MNFRLLGAAALSALIISSCTKKDDSSTTPTTPSSDKGSMTLYFDNMPSHSHGADELVYDANLTDTSSRTGVKYTNGAGDSLSIGFVRYWVSGVELYKADGSVYKPDSSYHLIQTGNLAPHAAKQTITLRNVPVGNYTKVKYRIGVDSARNFNSSALAGDLNTGIGMSWNWNTGYVFLKMEGRYKTATGSMKKYQLHIGNPPRTPAVSWSDPTSNFKTIELNFPEAAQVTTSKVPSAHIVANVLAPFGTSGANAIDLRQGNVIMVGPTAKTVTIMNNLQSSMFVVDHVHN